MRPQPPPYAAIVVKYTRKGSYIYQTTAGGRRRQVCNQLYDNGPTLMVSENEDVVAVIRREWARRSRAVKREREDLGL